MGSEKTNKKNLQKNKKKGTKIMDIAGKVGTFTSDIPYPLGLIGLIDVQKCMWQMDSLANQINCECIEQSDPNVFFLDNSSAKDLMNNYGWSNGGLLLYVIFTRLVYGCEPSQISAFHWLQRIKAAGGIEQLAEVKNGFQVTKQKKNILCVCLFFLLFCCSAVYCCVLFASLLRQTCTHSQYKLFIFLSEKTKKRRFLRDVYTFYPLFFQTAKWSHFVGIFLI